MTEILTESFCERCGTRYTFESAAPRKSRLARVRVLSKGVRNFVMSDDASLSEAMADARSEDEIAATSSQLDAFHQTFNFCLTCRQYTCSDCWNGPEGRCLTCAPIPGQEEPTGLVDFTPAVAAAAAPTNGHPHSPVEDDEAWPEADIAADRLARVFEGSEDRAGDKAGGTDEDSLAAATNAQAQPDAEHLISGLAPGQNLNDAIAAYEDLLEAEDGDSDSADLAVPVADEQPAAGRRARAPSRRSRSPPSPSRSLLSRLPSRWRRSPSPSPPSPSRSLPSPSRSLRTEPSPRGSTGTTSRNRPGPWLPSLLPPRPRSPRLRRQPPRRGSPWLRTIRRRRSGPRHRNGRRRGCRLRPRSTIPRRRSRGERCCSRTRRRCGPPPARKCSGRHRWESRRPRPQRRTRPRPRSRASAVGCRSRRMPGSAAAAALARASRLHQPGPPRGSRAAQHRFPSRPRAPERERGSRRLRAGAR